MELVFSNFIVPISSFLLGLESTEHILEKVADEGWSAENIVLGCGGGLLQKHNRDTLKFAFKVG